MDELIPIGRFARLAGLSVGALRHYDELDLLRPADTDRWTGYRRYRREQLETARTIARLRELELPTRSVPSSQRTTPPIAPACSSHIAPASRRAPTDFSACCTRCRSSPRERSPS